MTQIFADLSAMQGDMLAVCGEDYNHIKNVLRMHPGEKLAVRGTDESSEEYVFEIVSFSDSQVNCRLLSVKQSEAELAVRVILFQGLPKADKMDFIVQKTVEMGVTEIVPVEMHRSIVKLAGDKRRKRVSRWQSIAEAAAKQSRRAMIPRVHDILSYKEALQYAAEAADFVLVPYEAMADEAGTGTRSLLESMKAGQTAAVFVGPEGGFEESEIEAALEGGARTISLGKRILRTETAALAFMAFLIYRFELD
ncbi:MAG: 16S rRNA (uracil(1498)-N(3))-methyltransferase [Lachnospiraceae bacterium]|jgi:16S rRNA (uracil1498-N3)-methyltransferase|nr:16S rRNA (uracil(1498)-N(3))-methyltransferase [Lachnospiraceae bacterium]